jgi:hypothetical protein
VKRRPLRGGEQIAPITPSPPLLPDLPSPSLPAQEGEGRQGVVVNYCVGSSPAVC